MNREILFRGLSKETGRWVYGYLSKARNIEEKPAILEPCIDFEDRGVMTSCIVIPKTIGQYTGLTDKKGKKIFEGDIVRFPREPEKDCVVVWEDGRFRLEPLRTLEICNYLRSLCFISPLTQTIRVVGNIHQLKTQEVKEADR